MAEGDGQDKRHGPTERRLRRAAEEGDVGRSADLPKAAVIVIVTALALGAAAGIGAHLEDFCAAWLNAAGTAPTSAAGGWASTLIFAVGPLLMLIALVSTAATLPTGGWVFSLALLKPDLSKLMPAYGFGLLVSKSGLTDTAKALLKFIIIGGVGAEMIIARAPDFAALEASPNPSAGPAITLCAGHRRHLRRPQPARGCRYGPANLAAPTKTAHVGQRNA
jgi:flagellar biosynthesis protein FlhB